MPRAKSTKKGRYVAIVLEPLAGDNGSVRVFELPQEALEAAVSGKGFSDEDDPMRVHIVEVPASHEGEVTVENACSWVP
jgi:hypothetical protein